MNMRGLKLLVVAAFVVMAGSAQAVVNLGGPVGSLPASAAGPDPMFNFTFDIGSLDIGFGSLSATPLGGNQYLATSGSLTVTQSNNSDLANGSYTLYTGLGTFISPSGGFIVDNVLYNPANPHLDVYGLLFTDLSGNEINIWGNASGNYGNAVGNYSFYTCHAGCWGITDTGAGTFAVPEPAVWAMLLVGFGMLGGALRLRRDPAMTVA